MSARSRELLTLFLAGLVASTAFASAWLSDVAEIDYGWLPWAGILGGIFLVAHLVARWTVPDADPTLLPLPRSSARSASRSSTASIRRTAASSSSGSRSASLRSPSCSSGSASTIGSSSGTSTSSGSRRSCS